VVRRPLLVGNWKMHKTVAESVAFGRAVLEGLKQAGWEGRRELVLCPTTPALAPLADLLRGSAVGVGAQNLDLGREGAVTGGVSAYLLKAAGAQYVIVGHSERRRLFGEDDALIGAKVAAACAEGLVPIVCVGETAEERAGDPAAVVLRQLAAALEPLAAPTPDLVIAYEPVWAIGTGVVATPSDAAAMAATIRTWLAARFAGAADAVRVLYGGSVTAENLGAFWARPEIDGALVGGASLRVDEFIAMARVGGSGQEA
jgi:triosephosphate isomerase